MDTNSLKKKTIGGFIWRLAERVGAEGVTFVVSIILARLLDPSDYGAISLITVFTSILSVFINSGMGVALIQKIDADDLDYSSLFYFNMVMCLGLYGVMFFCAPLIADFYNMPELTAYVRVISLTLVISGVKGIQQSYVSKNMLFKKFFFSTLGGTLVSAVVGVVMAYKGFGTWALIGQQLSNMVIDTAVLWITVKWRPKWMFSFKRLKKLFSYGWKILASALLDTTYNQLRSLIIGKVYSAADLAYYNKAYTFPNVVITNINTSIDGVLLPSLSSVQDNRETLKAITRRSITMSTYIMAPFLMGLAACGESVISIILTDKWLPSYPYMVVICITSMFMPIHTANLNAIKAMGRSDMFLKLEIIKKIVGLTAVFVTFRISVMAMVLSLLVTSVLGQLINSWPNKKLMNYGYLEQLKDILPGILLAAVMGIAVYCVRFFNLNEWITLIIQVPLGVVIYIALSVVLKLEPFFYCIKTVKPVVLKMFKKEKKNKNEN